jgi:hypothetical protein
MLGCADMEASLGRCQRLAHLAATPRCSGQSGAFRPSIGRSAAIRHGAFRPALPCRGRGGEERANHWCLTNISSVDRVASTPPSPARLPRGSWAISPPASWLRRNHGVVTGDSSQQAAARRSLERQSGLAERESEARQLVGVVSSFTPACLFTRSRLDVRARLGAAPVFTPQNGQRQTQLDGA